MPAPREVTASAGGEHAPPPASAAAAPPPFRPRERSYLATQPRRQEESRSRCMHSRRPRRRATQLRSGLPRLRVPGCRTYEMHGAERNRMHGRERRYMPSPRRKYTAAVWGRCQSRVQKPVCHAPRHGRMPLRVRQQPRQDAHVVAFRTKEQQRRHKPQPAKGNIRVTLSSSPLLLLSRSI